MKFLLTFLCTLFIIQNTYSNDLNECSVPGDVLSRSFLYFDGDIVSKVFKRKGTAVIKPNFNFSEKMNTSVYAYFDEKFCKKISYKETVRRCNSVDIDVALGRGNELFKSYFDVRNSLDDRAKSFSLELHFAKHLSRRERFELSLNIVEDMVIWSSGHAIPKSSEDFSTMLNVLKRNATIGEAEFLELTSVKNTKILGLIAPTGVELSENEGNEIFAFLFDFSLDLSTRSKLITTHFYGMDLSHETSRLLAKDFFLFANSNGIPKLWKDTVEMLKASQKKGNLTEKQFLLFSKKYETENRKALGFDLKAQICKTETIFKYKNVIRSHKTRDFKKFSSQQVQVSGVGALLKGESESIKINFDGISSTTITRISGNNNKYKVVYSSDGDFPGTLKINLVGSRIIKTPNNTMKIVLSINKGFYQLALNDEFAHPSIIKSTKLSVEYYESRPLWFDRKIATRSYSFSENKKVILSDIARLSNRGRKVYAIYKISRKSEYFNNGFSNKRKSNKVK